MNYIQIAELVVSALFALLSLFTLHFVFFAIVGVFKKKTFPKTEEKLKYGLIIPARNEEAVVGGLIDSIRKCEYPQDKLHIFVIAHNCTDRTAEVARKMGATVYEYNNPNECTMGYAFRYLFSQIEQDYGTQNYDGFFLFNADNILEKHFFEKMNDAFVACDKKSVITSFRNSKNFGSNLMSAMYGLYFAYGCCFESRGRTVLGCSTRVQGTGYVISSEVVKNGWNYVTLTEDWEFTADQILSDMPIVYCDEAVFYDEQPTTFPVMWRQRVRWAKGHLLVCLSRFREIVRGLFRHEKKGGCSRKGSTYDIMVNITPFCVISFSLVLIQCILYLISPLFGIPLAVSIPRLLRGMLISFSCFYSVIVLSSVVLYIMERKRIPKMSLGLKILSAFVWPFFLALSIPCEIVALFKKNLAWKPIPHTDTTSFEALNVEEAAIPEQIEQIKQEIA